MSLPLPEDYSPDPYFDEDHGGSENETERLFSTFTVLTAFTLISAVPLFPVSAMETGVIDGNIVVNGTVYPGLTLQEATALEAEILLLDAAANAGTTVPRMSTEMSALVTRSATAGMAQGIGLFEGDVAALEVLENYSISAYNSAVYRGMGLYIGGVVGGGGESGGGFGHDTGGPGGLGGGPGSSYGGGPIGGFFGGPGPGPGFNPGGGGSPGTGPSDGGPPGYGGPTPPGIDPSHAPPWEDAGSSGGSCFDGPIFDYCLRLM